MGGPAEEVQLIWSSLQDEIRAPLIVAVGGLEVKGGGISGVCCGGGRDGDGNRYGDGDVVGDDRVGNDGVGNDRDGATVPVSLEEFGGVDTVILPVVMYGGRFHVLGGGSDTQWG